MPEPTYQTNQPSPEAYNPTTHFIQVVAKALNPEIRDFYDPNGEIEETDITTPTGALRRANLIDADENLQLVIAKMIFFGLLSGRLSADIGDKFYGIPKTSFKDTYKSLDVQVILLFKEDQGSARQNGRGKHPLDMRLSFRLLTPSTQLTTSQVSQLQTRLIQQFQPSFKHYKGLNKYSYHNPASGLNGTYLHANRRSDAKDIYQRICAVAGVIYDDDYLTESKKGGYKTETVTVLNETVKKTNKPRTGFVYFQRAELYLAGTKDRNLIQRYGNTLKRTSIV